MNGSTKILTVSYGTFSCTLEGFDDPLGSMREIAEYFRDLASDDRYFGAEPPTPDVEMLQRIAEKEVQRRVEARVSDTGGVALVASDTQEPAKTPPAERNAEPSGPLAFDDDYTMPDEPEDVLTVDPEAAPESEGPAESVAEKLRRIRAVVTRSIELEEASPVRREQSPNADDPDKRDRALSDTIRQIQSDLAEEGDEDTIEATAEEVTEKVHAVVQDAVLADDTVEDEDEDEHGDDGWNVDLSPREDAAPSAKDPDSSRATLAPEPDVGRLLDETDTKLQEDETVRRRKVISQMRAAVAATKADRLISRQVSSDEAEEAEKDAYRADLSDAVEDEPAPEKPADRPKTTPLVLVSSQRIDADAPGNEGQGFAAFIADFGARELPDLIEAAAAYTVFSEGQSSFTRPEIMKRVARIDPTLKLSREESLRSFGQLLRQGTFRKLERGQFTIEKSTRFNPDQRAATQ